MGKQKLKRYLIVVQHDEVQKWYIKARSLKDAKKMWKDETFPAAVYSSGIFFERDKLVRIKKVKKS